MGNSLKQTYIEGRLYVKRAWANRWGRGSKIENFEQNYFLNALLK